MPPPYTKGGGILYHMWQIPHFEIRGVPLLLSLDKRALYNRYNSKLITHNS